MTKIDKNALMFSAQSDKFLNTVIILSGFSFPNTNPHVDGYEFAFRGKVFELTKRAHL